MLFRLRRFTKENSMPVEFNTIAKNDYVVGVLGRSYQYSKSLGVYRSELDMILDPPESYIAFNPTFQEVDGLAWGGVYLTPVGLAYVNRLSRIWMWCFALFGYIGWILYLIR
jgi:hypothetical protein